ncbi:hypothetical protein LMG10661_03099 [Ralstonia syzygii subsp. syzygii]|nr:hypothetical protein LMG10661_03099 [Ralstonia syzygii subsp. syzygii]
MDARIRDQAARYVQFDSFHEILPLPENRIVPSATETDATMPTVGTVNAADAAVTRHEEAG